MPRRPGDKVPRCSLPGAQVLRDAGAQVPYAQVLDAKASRCLGSRCPAGTRHPMLRGPGAQAGAQVRVIVLKSIALMIQAFFQTDKIEKSLLLGLQAPYYAQGPRSPPGRCPG